MEAGGEKGKPGVAEEGGGMAGKSIVIRVGAFTDAAAIGGLLTERGYPASAADVRNRLTYWLREPSSRVLVAERDGVVVGSIALHVIPYLERTGRWLRIESLIVGAPDRRAGIGRALVGAAE